MLLLAIQQLYEPLCNIVLKDEELAAMLVLPDIKAENVVQIPKHTVAIRIEFDIGALLQIKQWPEEPYC